MIDKSIILVGNGSILKNQKLGHKIDEFDEIIRINDWKTRGFEDIAGTKTTIWGMYNPEKCGNRFLDGYKALGYDLNQMKDIVKDINEIWYICWNPENLLENWKKNNNIKELGIYSKTKRHLSMQVSKKIRKIIDPPGTGFTLIWILTHMYDKIYLAGFDFGGILYPESKNIHYFGNKTREQVEKTNIHNLKFEQEYINKLLEEEKIIYLTEEIQVLKSKQLEIPTYWMCNSCGKEIYRYSWESLICNYCESNL